MIGCRECERLTSGRCAEHSQFSVPIHGSATVVLERERGWQCPVCGRGNAPWVPFCNCKLEGASDAR